MRYVAAAPTTGRPSTPPWRVSTWTSWPSSDKVVATRTTHSA